MKREVYHNSPKLLPIDIRTYKGGIPTGYELIVMAKNGDPDDGIVLYGFDEVGLYDNDFNQPVYAFSKT